jgi:hypothetical protein
MGDFYFQGPSLSKTNHFKPVKRTKRVRISLYILLFSRSLRSHEDLPFFQRFVCQLSELKCDPFFLCGGHGKASGVKGDYTKI